MQLYWVDVIGNTVYPCTENSSAKAIEWCVLVNAEGTKDALNQARQWYGKKEILHLRFEIHGR